MAVFIRKLVCCRFGSRPLFEVTAKQPKLSSGTTVYLFSEANKVLYSHLKQLISEGNL